MADNKAPIGIFDSGVGGLTVLRALRELLPDEDYVYLGDTARLPYGTKSPESVRRYARHAAEFLLTQNIKTLVVACNTASAVALDDLRERLDVAVIGVVEPGAAAAVAQSKSQHHLVLATEATTGYRAYTKAIRQLRPAAQVDELPCSLFVALAEEGWHDGRAARVIAEQYLSGVTGQGGPDTAILGCTHFPLLTGVIGEVLGNGVAIVDSATTTAQAVKRELAAVNQLSAAGSGGLRLLATDGAARFARVGSMFLGQSFAAADIEVVDIHPADLGQ